MGFDWKKYLELASYLKNTPGCSSFLKEAAFRSVVSRAYYAAFCHARNYAVIKYGFTKTKSRSDHSLIRQEFTNHGKKKIADKLEDLSVWREACDYDEEVPALETQYLNRSISLAQFIINDLRLS